MNKNSHTTQPEQIQADLKANKGSVRLPNSCEVECTLHITRMHIMFRGHGGDEFIMFALHYNNV